MWLLTPFFQCILQVFLWCKFPRERDLTRHKEFNEPFLCVYAYFPWSPCRCIFACKTMHIDRVSMQPIPLWQALLHLSCRRRESCQVRKRKDREEGKQVMHSPLFRLLSFLKTRWINPQGLKRRIEMETKDCYSLFSFLSPFSPSGNSIRSPPWGSKKTFLAVLIPPRKLLQILMVKGTFLLCNRRNRLEQQCWYWVWR